MLATRGHIAKIHVLGKKLAFDVFDLHAEVQKLTKKTSIKTLTTIEAGRVIDNFEAQLAKRGQPNIPNSRVSGPMRGKILKYKYLLGWHDAHFWNFIKKMIGHDLPVGGSHERFSWMTPEEGYKVLEGLKAVYKKAKD